MPRHVGFPQRARDDVVQTGSFYSPFSLTKPLKTGVLRRKSMKIAVFSSLVNLGMPPEAVVVTPGDASGASLAGVHSMGSE